MTTEEERRQLGKVRVPITCCGCGTIHLVTQLYKAVTERLDVCRDCPPEIQLADNPELYERLYGRSLDP